jgi:hypothetical protein
MRATGGRRKWLKVDQLRLQLHVSNLQLLVVLMARLNVVKLKDGLYNEKMCN